jgi:hypothetical protein
MQEAIKEPKKQERSQAAPQQRQQDSGPIIVITGDDDDETIDPIKETAYLTAARWKKVAARDTPNPKKRWLDPESGKPARRVLVVRELRDVAGRIEKDAVYQTLQGSSPWFYSRQEAVQVQRDRDAAKEKAQREAKNRISFTSAGRPGA